MMARLSGAQRTVLENVRDAKPANAGVGFGGGTLRACRAHGLIGHTGDFDATWYITAKGRDALATDKFEKARKDK